MTLRHADWMGTWVLIVQLIMGCGRQGDARQRAPMHAADRPPAGTQQHAHAVTTTSEKTSSSGTAARALSPMERLARGVEDFSAALGLQAKSFTLHPELRLVDCSNVFDVLPDEEFQLMIYDFYAARVNGVNPDELRILREIIDRRLRRTVRTSTPSEYGGLLTMKLQTYYHDGPMQDYAGFLDATRAALALVRDVHGDTQQLNEYVVTTLVAAGGAFPVLQYYAMRRGGAVEHEDMVRLIDTELRANPTLSSRQRALLTDVKYHCLVIPAPERVLQEGRAFLASVPVEQHVSLALLVEGLEKGLRGEELARYREEKIRAALRRPR